jgi:hypothetical protein
VLGDDASMRSSGEEKRQILFEDDEVGTLRAGFSEIPP